MEILQPHTDVAVVVHSSWRAVYNEAELKHMRSVFGDMPQADPE